MNIILLPDNKRLKQLIREFGSEWTIVQKEDHVQCFDGNPGLFIQSICGKHTRWVRPIQVVNNIEGENK